MAEAKPQFRKETRPDGTEVVTLVKPAKETTEQKKKPEAGR